MRHGFQGALLSHGNTCSGACTEETVGQDQLFRWSSSPSTSLHLHWDDLWREGRKKWSHTHHSYQLGQNNKKILKPVQQTFAMNTPDVHLLDLVKWLSFVTDVHRWPAGIMQPDNCCFLVEKVRLWLLQMILTQSSRNLQVQSQSTTGLPGLIYFLINFVCFACHIWAMYNDLYF